ncbi:MAG TPA: exodeoxyribonuclease VII large subunit, partial [Candidatus Cloacimonadota bacterium]|nr:exodeoxyribonuclease VII large subunit [Candidatus Cloacimonadota bacterium]
KLHSMQYAVKQALFSRRLEVHELEKKLREYHPQNILQKMHQRLEASTLRLSHIAKLRTKELHSRLSILQNQLKELSPQEALQRGYAFLRKERKLVHSIKELHLKDKVEILLADGQLEAELTAIKEDNKDLRS